MVLVCTIAFSEPASGRPARTGAPGEGNRATKARPAEIAKGPAGRKPNKQFGGHPRSHPPKQRPVAAVAAYARAREAQAELYADDIIEIADAATEDEINSARLKIDARKWVVTRLLPRYAKKLVHEGGEKPVAVALELSDREIARQIVRILNQADPKKKS